MPSDQGLHSLSSGSRAGSLTNPGQLPAGAEVDAPADSDWSPLGVFALTHLIEAGLYSLTKDEAPCMLHFGSERTEQWLLVRLQEPESSTK